MPSNGSRPLAPATSCQRRLIKPGARIGLSAVALGAVGLAYARARFAAELRVQKERVGGRTAIVRTRHGLMEYATAGTGRPFLMVHGTGGGFDQALTFAEGLLPHGHRILAPSRFGYLRSDFPADPCPENQADAFADLLDHLGLGRVAVAGVSAGTLSAVQFALRHPHRCSALVLVVPAANLRDADPVEMTAAQAFFVRHLAGSDFLFWTALHTARHAMISTLLATDPALVEGAEPAEGRRADRILREVMPVSLRSEGMLNDAHFAGQPTHAAWSEITAPTLIVSAEDDRFGTAATAREIAARVAGSQLVMFPKGGHMLVGHYAQLWAKITNFLRSAASSANDA